MQTGPLTAPASESTVVIRRTVDGEEVRLAPHGELVYGSADALDEALARMPRDAREIILDMSQVTFMDTAGMHFLDRLHDYGRAHGLTVRVVDCTGQPQRVLELAGHTTAGHRDTAEAAPGSPVALERAERLSRLQQEVGQLKHAVVSRSVVDQACGILMAGESCSAGEAWQILVDASQHTNLKLRTIAEAVVGGTEGSPPPEAVRTALKQAASRRQQGRRERP